MRKTGPRSKNVSGDLKFGSDVADLLGLPVEEVAAIVGAIVGHRADAFAVAVFQDGRRVPLMVSTDRKTSTATRIERIVEDCFFAGAKSVVCAILASTAWRPNCERQAVASGVRFLSLEPVKAMPEGREGLSRRPLATSP